VSSGEGYRLPTEAEWEYACRAGTSTEFYFGDDPDRLDGHGWFAANSEQSAKAVGLKRANAFGLRDVYGNAREWCEDWYSADYYAESSPVDPRGPSSGTLRATRGGSWYSGAARARSGDRAGVAPTFHSSQFGFRVLRGL
jgi:formylglycine-generating enzyme required for sulfatase activity